MYVDQETDLSGMSEGDALVTDQPNIVIGVRTADCVPVLCFDPEKNVCAAIHAGHKGTLEGIVQNTFSLMQRLFTCRPEDAVLAIGPAICLGHYEVGPEVIADFKKKFGERFVCQEFKTARPHLDVRGTIQLILEDLGVLSSNIDTLDLCTFERDDLFYSYRRDGNDVGRPFDSAQNQTVQGLAQGRQFNFVGMVE